MSDTNSKHTEDAREGAKKVLSKRSRMLTSSEIKRQVFYGLENVQNGKPVTKLVGGFLFLLIVANAVLVFLSAQPDLEPLATNILRAFFVFSTVCFFIEYICRVWIADLAFGNCTRLRARMKYIFSFMGIIDFLSFAPSMLSWFLPVNSTIIHVVNLLRLIRLLKVTRYMRGFRTMGRVLDKHKQEIIAAFLVIILLAIVASLVMYEVEHEAQPDKFNSLFQGFWFAVQTVTSTGYGDIVPITPVGKVCGMVIMMLSLGLIAIPGGIFSAGFVAEFQNANMRKIERDVQRNRHTHEDEERWRSSESSDRTDSSRDENRREDDDSHHDESHDHHEEPAHHDEREHHEEPAHHDEREHHEESDHRDESRNHDESGHRSDSERHESSSEKPSEKPSEETSSSEKSPDKKS